MVNYSFIVPVYNCEKYIETCILSILRQNIKTQFEVILVNDGSQDKSGELANKLADKYANVRVFHKINGGAASARNRGLSEAKGKYILFIDGDDTIAEDLLEKVDHIVKNEEKAMIIYGMSFDYFRHGKLECSDKKSCIHDGEYISDKIFAEYKSFFDDNALSSACNKVFSAEIIRRNDLKFNENMTLYEDYDFVLRYLKYIRKICCISEPLYHYRHDLDNVHFYSRVYDLNQLRQNLKNLLVSSMEVDNVKTAGTHQVIDVAGNLYMQLLVHNLLSRKYSIAELKSCLSEYCSEPLFRRSLENGVEFKKEYLQLLEDIDEGKIRLIQYRFIKRKYISGMKRMLKKLLNLNGIMRMN